VNHTLSSSKELLPFLFSLGPSSLSLALSLSLSLSVVGGACVWSIFLISLIIHSIEERYTYSLVPQEEEGHSPFLREKRMLHHNNKPFYTTKPDNIHET
jgi:hypothetical protein